MGVTIDLGKKIPINDCKLQEKHSDKQFFAFQQANMLADPVDHNGLCGSLTNLFIHKKLLSASVACFTKADYFGLIDEAHEMEKHMAAAERDGLDGDSFAILESRKPAKYSCVTSSQVSPLLKDSDVALVKYKMKSGFFHQLAFARMPHDRCALFDPSQKVEVMPCHHIFKSFQSIIEKSTTTNIQVVHIKK